MSIIGRSSTTVGVNRDFQKRNTIIGNYPRKETQNYKNKRMSIIDDLRQSNVSHNPRQNNPNSIRGSIIGSTVPKPRGSFTNHNNNTSHTRIFGAVRDLVSQSKSYFIFLWIF